LVAPVALVGFDEMGREDLAGAEIDDRDRPLVDDGEDPAAGVRRADLMRWCMRPLRRRVMTPLASVMS
jgi:hypothetical protein